MANTLPDDVLELVTQDQFIYAGTKIVDKAGGPIMSIAGFDKTSDSVNSNGQLKTSLYQKVFVNLKGLTYDQLGIKGNLNSQHHYFYFTDLLDANLSDYVVESYRLFIICKYWSNQVGDFVYVNKNLSEIEPIK